MHFIWCVHYNTPINVIYIYICCCLHCRAYSTLFRDKYARELNRNTDNLSYNEIQADARNKIMSLCRLRINTGARFGGRRLSLFTIWFLFFFFVAMSCYIIWMRDHERHNHQWRISPLLMRNDSFGPSNEWFLSMVSASLRAIYRNQLLGDGGDNLSVQTDIIACSKFFIFAENLAPIVSWWSRQW